MASFVPTGGATDVAIRATAMVDKGAMEISKIGYAGNAALLWGPLGPGADLDAEEVAGSDAGGVIHGHLLGPRPWLSPLPSHGIFCAKKFDGARPRTRPR